MDLYADGRIRSIHGRAEDVLRVYREVVRSSVVCPSCSQEADGLWRFCAACGYELRPPRPWRQGTAPPEGYVACPGCSALVATRLSVCPCGTELAPAEAGDRFSHGGAGTVVQIGSVYGDISVHGGDPPRPGEAETDPGAEAGPADDPPGETAR